MRIGLQRESIRAVVHLADFLRKSAVLEGLVLAALVLLAPALWAKSPHQSLPALEGVLHSTAPSGPVLKMQNKEQRLSGFTKYIYHTLQDKRLDGRQVRVEGKMLPDGSFQVEWLHTIHNGKLYQVRYFCKTCNIVALEPGKCVCCQKPTELQEIPVSQADQ